MIKDLAEFGWHGHVIDTSKISYVGVIEYIDARVREQTTEGGWFSTTRYTTTWTVIHKFVIVVDGREKGFQDTTTILGSFGLIFGRRKPLI